MERLKGEIRDVKREIRDMKREISSMKESIMEIGDYLKEEVGFILAEVIYLLHEQDKGAPASKFRTVGRRGGGQLRAAKKKTEASRWPSVKGLVMSVWMS
jgi:hypothetical protein